MNQIITFKEDTFYDDFMIYMEDIYPLYLNQEHQEEYENHKDEIIQEWIDLGFTKGEGEDSDLIFPKGTEFRIADIPVKNPENYSNSVYLIPAKSKFKVGILIPKDYLKEWIKSTLFLFKNSLHIEVYVI